VVSWAQNILVFRYQDPKPYYARVKFIGHDCDLAVLEVNEPSFFDGLKALSFGDLPKVRSSVITYGYPSGGDQISYTRGVVSRIDLNIYAHQANRAFLAVQTDAAINPGNSGGPVVQNGNVVGVAFQGISVLENAGFFIPTPIIQHFLTDIQDGYYHGFPETGLKITTLQNPTYRSFLKLPSNNEGAKIDGFLNIPATQKRLQQDDVLLQAGPYKVGSDSTIIYQGNRVHVGAAFDEIQNGESIQLKVWREGKEVNISLPMYFYNDDYLEGKQYDKIPRYYIYAGIVFTPLSYDFLSTLGKDWYKKVRPEIIYELNYRRDESPNNFRKEPIIISSILAHPINSDMQVKQTRMIDKINGVRIECLEDVIKAFENNNLNYDRIDFVPDGFEVIDRTKVKESQNEIMKEFNIVRDRRL
jgi:hypothetical protein